MDNSILKLEGHGELTIAEKNLVSGLINGEMSNMRYIL